MAESNFVDYVKIYCRSGKGGRGSTHMRREKYVPNGGPDGGDGGRGGHVILRGNRNYWTLLHLKYDRHVFATHGGNGSKNKSFGKDGEDKVIEVPCGTVVYNAETGEYICDITEDGQEVVLLKGGRGGLGNWHFRTATRQAPRFAQPGEPMQELTVILELKLLADVGLVGFPNAGKSTLLSTVSAARPKIANYPFTTLEPNLGIVSYREGKSFVMADIPGIIEGASEGKGLGLRFLRHIERNSLLLFMVPGDTDDIRKEYDILLNELATFNPEMLDKQRVLAITKSDMLDEELINMLEPTLPKNVPHIFISSVTGMGIQQLKDMKRLTSDNKMLGYELMKAYPNISCFSTTRHGGCSEGNYASFNCTGYCGDEAEHVQKNREILCELLPQKPLELIIPHQTHSTNIGVIDDACIRANKENRLEDIDAIITELPGYCLCISTADCIPVLLYDPTKQVIAAAHAGWRGTVGKIVAKTLAVMKERYASEEKDIKACIGPGISLAAFEVGDEVYETFRTAGFDMRRIARKEEKWHIDLWEANRLQLLGHGVKAENIEVAGICTYQNYLDFFSARRLGIRSGRILSGIMLHR